MDIDDVGVDGADDEKEEDDHDDDDAVLFMARHGSGGWFWQHVVWCAIWVGFLLKIIPW